VATNDDNMVELKVLGITRSEVQTGAYALLMQTIEEDPEQVRRIPIVVGIAEAQSIAVHLEGVMPSRPLTHDLFTSLFHAYGIELERVTIYSFRDGVFAAMMQLTNGTVTVDIDARTSDAVAIALRTGAHIYTTRDIVERTGYAWHRDAQQAGKPRTLRLEELPVEQLEERMKHYVDLEQYERAAQIQKIIAQKTNPPHSAD